MRRRAFLAALAAALVPSAARGQVPERESRPTPLLQVTPGFGYERVVPRALRFPEDHGAHPGLRTEWWYATGWLEAGGRPLGFQLTFFRTRLKVDPGHPSAFAAKQVIVAHAAVSDPAFGRLVHGQRIARSGFGLAGARGGDTGVWVDDWRLVREGGVYHTQIAGDELGFELSLTPTQPPLPQGEAGYSQKGPQRSSASHYYSLPHLAVAGTVTRKGRRDAVNGSAWLDHEWSSEYLDEAAQGWDWCGINLDDGGALMAFRMRAKAGGVHWAGGALRDAGGRLTIFAPGDIAFTPSRSWRSPRTGVEYPVAIALHAGDFPVRIEPLMDDQELDSRATTGAIYWEGAVTALREGRRVGRGYLELTGYAERLRL